MLKEHEFQWIERKTNNIKTNPLDGYCCIIDTEDCARLYIIKPQYPEIKQCCIDSSMDPELYILFEATGHKATEEDKKHVFYDAINYNGYMFSNETFIRAYKTLEDAKARAYINYKMIYGYVLAHIVDNVEDATGKHRCIIKEE